MIKRSAILLLFLATGSVFLLVYAAYRPASPDIQPAPVKCCGQCNEKTIPAQWNIVSPTFFQSES